MGKMSPNKKEKETLRQVFIRVYILEIQGSHVGIFDPAF
jgi:hypothetical protein